MDHGDSAFIINIFPSRYSKEKMVMTVILEVNKLVKNTVWAMQGMLDLVLRQQGLSAILPEVAVLLGFAVVFYTLGILCFRYG